MAMPDNLADVPRAAPIDVDVDGHGTIDGVDTSQLFRAVVGLQFLRSCTGLEEDRLDMLERFVWH